VCVCVKRGAKKSAKRKASRKSIWKTNFLFMAWFLYFHDSEFDTTVGTTWRL